ncbi:MAG: pyridoxal-dependent decarboxylase [Planctomycetota bacterium]|nr:pyridoxal-dependent decarboxylase [Planctomycetota bacterium]
MVSTAETFHTLLPIVEQRLSAYLKSAEAREGRVIQLKSPEVLDEELGIGDWIARGGMDAKALDSWLKQYLEATTKLHHPGYIGHQVAVPMVGSSLADCINGFTNNGMAVHEMGPPAVAVELAVLRWMCAHVGYGKAGGGVLTHGGSLANLTALLAARAVIAPDAWEQGVPQDLVLVTADTAHYSIARSAGILGLGSSSIRTTPTKPDGTIDISALNATLEACAAEGKRVMAVVASACNTATGCIDDLQAMGEICANRALWFHVDGAHGASALLSEKHRGALRGIEMADSVVWDAHKMLHTSALCAAVLLKRETDFAKAFHQDVSYLGNPGFAKGPDLFRRAVECTKVPIGLKLFLNLAIHGEVAMTKRIDDLYARAKQAAALFREHAQIDVPLEPQTNILLFRVGDSSISQRELRSRLMERGNFYITAADHCGVDYLRLTVMNPATSVEDLQRLMDELVELADGMASS